MNFEAYLDSLRGRSVAVIGIGVSNQPLIRLLLDRGIQVTVCDKKNREDLGELGDELERHGCCLQLGEDYLKDLTEDVIFRTPGLRPDVPELAAAVERGSRLTSEMEVFFEVCPCTEIAVTAPPVISLLESLQADRRDEVLHPEHFLTELFIDHRSICKCKKLAVRVHLADLKDIFLAHCRFAAGIDIHICSKLFALTHDRINILKT